MSQRQMNCDIFKERVLRKTTMEFAKNTCLTTCNYDEGPWKRKTRQQQQGQYLIKLTDFIK